MKLKRLWDTTTKQMVLLRDSQGKSYQVWTNDDGSNLYIYDKSQWMEYNPETSEVPAEVYWPVWKPVSDDDVVGVYDTNEPTDLYTWESGEDVSYTFKNGTTTLQSWTVKEGETPEYTGDTPTKAATAQYTYTFDDWNPEVWPIYKKTNYKATFTSTVNKYDITFVDYDNTQISTAEVDYGTVPTAPADPTREWYTFTGWDPTIAAVTQDQTYTAQYEQILYTVWLSAANYVWDENEGDEGDYVPAGSQDPLWWTFSPATVSVPAGAVISIDQTAGEGEHTIDFMVGDEAVATIAVEVDTDAAGEGYEVVFDLGDLSGVTWVADDGEGNYTVTGAATLPVMFMASDIS